MTEIIPSDRQIQFLKGMPTNQLGPAISIVLYEAVRSLVDTLGLAVAAVDILAERLGTTDDDFFEADDWLCGERPKPHEGADGDEVIART